MGVGSRTEATPRAQSHLKYKNSLLYSEALEVLSLPRLNAEKCATLKDREPFTVLGETKKACTVLETN